MRLGVVPLSLILMAMLPGCSGERKQSGAASEQPVQFQRASAQLIGHGKRVSQVLGCNGCHGENLMGEDWSEPGFGRLWTSNLTRAAETYSDEELAKMIRTGVRPDDSELWGMPSFLFTHLSDPDMAAVLAYLRSRPAAGQVHPRPVFEEGGRRALAAGELKSSAAEVRERTRDWPPDLGPDHALARYLSRATCAECHGLNLAGRQRLGGGKPPPDLRIVGAYDAQQFERLLRTGRAAGDRELELMSGVARGRYRHFTNEELTQLYSYLREIGSSK